MPVRRDATTEDLKMASRESSPNHFRCPCFIRTRLLRTIQEALRAVCTPWLPFHSRESRDKKGL
jgi:hypothetical protein